MKHICCLHVFYNTEHTIKCFESLKNLDMDFIILEDESIYSPEIQNYFSDKNILKYCLFKDSGGNALSFYRDEVDLFKQYDYITFSDCDLYHENQKEVFNEITSILDNYSEVGVCSASLSHENLPSWSRGWGMSGRDRGQDYIEARTGIWFSTFRGDFTEIFNVACWWDYKIIDQCNHLRKKWVRAKNNSVYHLTWDLYSEHPPYSDYQELKQQRLKSGIFSHKDMCDKTFDYEEIEFLSSGEQKRTLKKASGKQRIEGSPLSKEELYMESEKRA